MEKTWKLSIRAEGLQKKTCLELLREFMEGFPPYPTMEEIIDYRNKLGAYEPCEGCPLYKDS